MTRVALQLGHEVRNELVGHPDHRVAVAEDRGVERELGDVPDGFVGRIDVATERRIRPVIARLGVERIACNQQPAPGSNTAMCPGV